MDTLGLQEEEQLLMNSFQFWLSGCSEGAGEPLYDVRIPLTGHSIVKQSF